MQTITLEDKEFGIIQLLDLIQRMEEAIKFHATAPNPDRLAIEQYTDRLNEYRTTLADELRLYGLEFVPKVA